MFQFFIVFFMVINTITPEIMNAGCHDACTRKLNTFCNRPSKQFDFLESNEEENDIFRFSPCIRSIASRICVIDNKIDLLNPTTIESCCDRLSGEFSSCCDEINSKIDVACGATSIHQGDVDADPVNGYVIDEPGHYCCAENLMGGSNAVITISSSYVTLDLNGYALTADITGNGIIIDGSSSHTGIVIHNGFIVGNNDGTSQYGIGWINAAPGSKDLSISNISINNFRQGEGAGIQVENVDTLKMLNCAIYNNTENIQLTSCAQVFLDECLISDASGNEDNTRGNGGHLIGCKSITIKNSSFFQNWMNGLLIESVNQQEFINSSVIFIEDSLFNDNGARLSGSYAGLRIEANGEFIQAQLINCIFSITNDIYNPPFTQDFGLYVLDAGIISAQSCQANNNNVAGFNFNSLEQINIVHCQASHNRNIDKGAAGFLIINVSQISLQDCFANDNEHFGYFLSDSNTGSLDNCVAETNGNSSSDSGFFVTQCSNITFKNCVASQNFGDGFMISDSPNIDFTRCSASSHEIGSGFRFISNSSGLVRECNAINNGVCGFDTYSTSISSGFPKFVANCAEHNGINPAGSVLGPTQDTNYCVALTPTPFNAVTGFSATPIQPPYYQINTTNANVITMTIPGGTGYWSNVTLP